MKEIILKMDSPHEAEYFTLLLFQQGFRADKAIISYNRRKNLPIEIGELPDYPLILEGTLNGHEMRVSVKPLSIGRRNDGSYSLRNILKTANIYYDEQDLFTVRRFNRENGQLHLTLSRK